ncbi:MAG: flagellar basal body-associated FliL family protein [bacterium]|nr:flagellar basal body-associated FliL family protein [bacterium]
MKKNLLSIIILALLVVNLVMTGIMMFSVINVSNKNAKLVGDIAALLSIETKSADGEEEQTSVSIDDTDVYVISDRMTIPFQRVSEADGGDGKDHYFVVNVSLSMNKKHKDYKTYGTAEEMAARETLIKTEIQAVIGSYTMDQFKENQELIREEVLERIQTLYDSTFIFNVNFSDYLYS